VLSTPASNLFEIVRVFYGSMTWLLLVLVVRDRDHVSEPLHFYTTLFSSKVAAAAHLNFRGKQLSYLLECQ
jgi:hypothetical protein